MDQLTSLAMKKVEIMYPDFVRSHFPDKELEQIEDWAGRIYQEIFELITRGSGDTISSMELSILACIVREVADQLHELLIEGFKEHMKGKGELQIDGLHNLTLKFTSERQRVRE